MSDDAEVASVPDFFLFSESSGEGEIDVDVFGVGCLGFVVLESERREESGN